MKIINGFKQFILRGNVVDLAVGVVIGAAFTGFVNAIVKDLLTPFIGAIAKVPDFSSLKFTINESQFLYGDFLNVFISFVIIAATVYFCVILPVNTLIAKTKREEKQAEPTTKKCSECLSEIPLEAKRCAFCATRIQE
ncbi:MAG: large conductance mechanosensitive channel protein MscL [Candidatus Paceibacterota bacterium]|jgi:large conductance mechanosensitive channel